MLKIRLQRVGRKHDPSFRVVLSDSRRAAQSGGFLEILGNYDPRKHAENFQANSARIAEWISRGAQLSGTVHNLHPRLRKPFLYAGLTGTAKIAR